MARCYSGFMRRRHPIRSPLPDIWIISDARNDARLERALARAPRSSGLIFRHYHLGEPDRKARFRELTRLARAKGHMIVLSGSPREARRWGADGCYCAPAKAGVSVQRRFPVSLTRSPPARGLGLRLLTVHDMGEIAVAHRAQADAILLSPVFATRSHPAAKDLGPVRFRLLARYAMVPVIALGGMNRKRARGLRWKKWAAIDGI